MMIANDAFSTNLSSPVRNIRAKVELYNGSALVATYADTDNLKSLTINRAGEDSKFFGFGICQRLSLKLIDSNRALNITTANHFKVYLGFQNNYLSPFPDFHVTEVNRDENTNQLSITAYDLINEAQEHLTSELTLNTPYTIKQFTDACSNLMGFTSVIIKNVPETNSSFNIEYPTGANFEGSESIRDALNDVAEATQSIYYLDKDNNIVFKRLDRAGAAQFVIDKNLYFTLSSKTNRRLSAICHATELGDNVIAEGSVSGTTQYVRDNAFWELRDDIATLVENALKALNGLTINQFICSWRGDYRLEIGDKIALVTKDGQEVYSYLLNDTLKFDGTLTQQTQWQYTDSEETAANPSTLGDALKQTFAKVDKANKRIDIVTSDVQSNSEKVSKLGLDVDSINASVSSIEKNTSNQLDSMNSTIGKLTKKVESSMTSEQVKLEIKKELEGGVDKVTTSTGFTFDETGLSVSKNNSEMKTTITEDGMTVYRDNTAVLVANNSGVDATNLHATTYLWVGSNSRFEDYLGNRTGCFWVGN